MVEDLGPDLHLVDAALVARPGCFTQHLPLRAVPVVQLPVTTPCAPRSPNRAASTRQVASSSSPSCGCATARSRRRSRAHPSPMATGSQGNPPSSLEVVVTTGSSSTGASTGSSATTGSSIGSPTAPSPRAHSSSAFPIVAESSVRVGSTNSSRSERPVGKLIRDRAVGRGSDETRAEVCSRRHEVDDP